MNSPQATERETATRKLENQLVVGAFARVNARALGVSVGVLGALLLFLATVVLLASEAMAPTGHPVGAHLNLLDQFLPGYSVSWTGAFVGLAYGVIIGFVIGAVLGWLLNFSHYAYVRHIQRSLRRGVMHDAL